MPEGYTTRKACYYRLFSQNEAFMHEYVGDEKKVEFPSEVWGYKVTALSELLDSPKIEEVIIPETVKRISFIFYGCKNLKQVILPSQLECVGELAFMGSGIERIELPETVKEIGTAAFQYSG